MRSNEGVRDSYKLDQNPFNIEIARYSLKNGPEFTQASHPHKMNMYAPSLIYIQAQAHKRVYMKSPHPSTHT